MYLSSRSVGQANITRDYINTLVQGRHRMPVGPVIISPHGLLPSLYRCGHHMGPAIIWPHGRLPSLYRCGRRMRAPRCRCRAALAPLPLTSAWAAHAALHHCPARAAHVVDRARHTNGSIHVARWAALAACVLTERMQLGMPGAVSLLMGWSLVATKVQSSIACRPQAPGSGQEGRVHERRVLHGCPVLERRVLQATWSGSDRACAGPMLLGTGHGRLLLVHQRHALHGSCLRAPVQDRAALLPGRGECLTGASARCACWPSLFVSEEGEQGCNDGMRHMRYACACAMPLRGQPGPQFHRLQLKVSSYAPAQSDFCSV